MTTIYRQRVSVRNSDTYRIKNPDYSNLSLTPNRTEAVSVVIPAMNEEKNIPYVLDALPRWIYECILVDGNSKDNTVRVAREVMPSIKVVRQTRRGKGNALACGFNAASGDIIVMLDADCSTRPDEIKLFVETLIETGADFAKGSRSLEGGGSADLTALRWLGNWALSKSVNVLFKTDFTDLCYGYNAFWADILPEFDLQVEPVDPFSTSPMLWGDGFEIETLLALRAASANLNIVEIPSVEDSRLHGRSNLNAFRDGVRVARTIRTEWKRRKRPIGQPQEVVVQNEKSEVA
ncbi:MAG: glycosyltransferase family 2 protein [Acidimicrobiales bacterium]|nr:glycosyltransferase family 2 protein [Acidimicrobiales bacterium]